MTEQFARTVGMESMMSVSGMAATAIANGSGGDRGTGRSSVSTAWYGRCANSVSRRSSDSPANSISGRRSGRNSGMSESDYAV